MYVLHISSHYFPNNRLNIKKKKINTCNKLLFLNKIQIYKTSGFLGDCGKNTIYHPNMQTITFLILKHKVRVVNGKKVKLK